jgi:hypothetical protein
VDWFWIAKLAILGRPQAAWAGVGVSMSMKEMRIKKIDRTAIRFIFPSRTLYLTIQLDLPGFLFWHRHLSAVIIEKGTGWLEI